MPHGPTSPRMASFAAVVALSAAVGAAAAGGPAFAAPGNPATTTVKQCASQPRPATCQVGFTVPVPETVRGTVDKLSPFTVTYVWTVTDRLGVVRCSGTYRPADPVRPWSCALTAGPYTFSTLAENGPTRITVTY